ncbi:peptide/nickel transport system permease protein [Paenibacillus phyllosphaerae]|uniref:Peptide/nickel transport system permease protein n=1 Tax=Paenibacillus phyllosphaerae TaxID=274593 RepID=A0A7W5B1U1_9BACL|nr:ABC transporter permease [Paenibacillus phyllosphaerae]MBB3112808.1 peptide/nickel transport system permease protein [Paenibacillus phyllosphaerae]
MNLRKKTLGYAIVAFVLLLLPVVLSPLLGSEQLATHLTARNEAPSWSHPFGTDWLGRDMFTRSIKGLALSLGVGLTAALASGLIAGTLGLMAATLGKAADRFISWLIDLFLSVPHLVLLLLIAFVTGGGVKGVIIAVGLTHWPSLARLIRAEILQLKSSEFVLVSRHMGRSRWWIATRHLLPHLWPQFIVGTLLLFPHAILHEAAITFLGMGLSPHQPAIGIILSESMRYLSTGMWWLAFFPGLCLLILVRSFDVLATNLYALVDPNRSQE